MALSIRPVASTKGKLLSTLFIAFALVAQPVYGFVASELARAVSAATPDLYVDGSNGNDGNDCTTTGSGACATISRAVSLASDGDVISVAAGTYSGVVSINKSVTIEGVSGAVVNGQMKIETGASDVTLRNLEINNDDIVAGAVVKIPSAVSLDSLTLDGLNLSSYKSIYAADGTSSTIGNLTIKNSTVTSNYPVYVDHAVDVIDVTNNVFNITGNLNRGIVFAKQATGNSVSISGNTFNAGVGTDLNVMNFVKYEPVDRNLLQDVISQNTFSSNIGISSDNKAIVPIGDAEVTHVDAYYKVDPDYTAIGVDFKTKNITSATDIELRVNRVGGATYSIHATPSLVSAINAASDPTSTSGPIVISGSRTSSSWTNQTGTWTGSALPVSVEVIITFADKPSVSLLDDTISTNKATWDQVKPNEAPAITVATPVNNGTVGTKANGNKLKVTGRFTDDERANYMNVFLIKDGVLRAQGIVYGYGTPGSAPNYADVNGNFTLSMDVPANLESGSYMLRFVGTDHNAFSPHTTVERNFTIDNTNPETTLFVPTGLAGNTFTISGVASDNMALSRVYVQLKHLESNTRYGGTTIHLSGTEQNWSREFDATSLDLPEGTYIAHVQATDKVGNRFDEGWSAEFTLDKTAPTASLVSSHATPTTDDIVTVTGSVNDDDIKSHWFEITAPDGLKYYRFNLNTTDKVMNFDLRSATSTGHPTSAAAPYTGVPIPTDTEGNLLPGEYKIVYAATDRAGNRSDSVAPAILVLNVTEPAPVVVTPPVTPPAAPVSSGESPEVDEEERSLAQIFTSPAFFGFGTPSLEDEDTDVADTDDGASGDSAVLGEQDEVRGTPLADTGEVLGIMEHKVFGIAWYWYLVIFAAVVGAWILLAGATRRSNNEA